MSRVKKPCPACKTTDHHRQDADSICCQCIKELQQAKDLYAASKKIDKSEVYVNTFERAYALPGFYHIIHGVNLTSESKEKLQKAIHDIIMSGIIRRTDDAQMYDKTPMQVPPVAQHGSYDWSIRVIMSKIHAKAVCDLDAAIRVALEEVATAAYEKGQNLLLGIAGGDVSMNDLNKATIGKK